MAKKLISYKVLYYVSLIPVLGTIIALFCSWINIYRATNNRKYVFLHYIIWIFPVCIVGVIVAVCISTFMANFSPTVYFIFGIAIAYVACLIMALSGVAISKWIVNKWGNSFTEE